MAKTVVGVLDGKYRYKTEIKAGAHYIISDEPESSGGTDHGPDPILITMGGLASCITMTVRMYTDRKGWKFDRLSVEVETEVQRIQEENDLNEEERSFVVDGRLRIIRKNITVTGNLDESQIKRIGEIAEKCPVNRMMNRNVMMSQTIKRSD